MATDLRFPGGNSSSVAEEVRAQAAAGYTTGLLHVPSNVVKTTRAFNSRFVEAVHAGNAQLIRSGVAIRTKLLLVRHPTTLPNLTPTRYPITADHRYIIVNQVGQVGERVVYEADVLAREFESRFGSAVWAPISPLIRESLEPYANQIEIATDDWYNIIDVDEWHRKRERPSPRPVIGRHSRDHPLKWPATAEEILAAYPANSDFEVRVLGGADAAAQVLGALPPSWEVLPYAVGGAQEFLRSIDFFVYFHHPELREAFGRAIFEALASGAVAIIPPEYEPLFGDACVYAEPWDVQRLVRAYSEDPAAYRAQSERGASFARAKFGYEIHRSRVEALIGSPGEKREDPRRSPKPVRGKQRLLFMSSNGAGVGHLTRLMAMARQASADVQPVVFTLSQGIRWVEESGFPVEYLGSQRYLSEHKPNPYWNRLLQHRLEHLIELYRPAGIIFDGTQPYRGLLDTFEAHPDIVAAWCRRGMWQPHIAKNLRGLSEYFDLVIEPGEIATSKDRGITKKFQKFSTVVEPITFLSRNELLSAREARAALSLDEDRPTALIQLGAGNINDTSSLVSAAVTTLSEDPTVQIRIARSAIAGRLDNVPGADWVDAYPLSRYLNAFDFVVGAAGYNTFHEVVGFGVPSILVPNGATEVDDQMGRAEYARSRGAALLVKEQDTEAMKKAVRQLLNPMERAKMRTALGRLRPLQNGAIVAMAEFELAVATKQAEITR